MTRKITASLLVLLGAFTTQAPAEEPPQKPTKADVQKVVQIVSGDPAKLATYCKLAAIDDEMTKAGEANDGAKLDQLSKQAEDLQKTMGPEFLKLVAGLDDIDPQSKESEDLLALFDPLDKQCEQKK